MKLVIFGLSVSSSWGNGHATIWRGLIRELICSGHKVTFFEKNTEYYEANRDLTCIDGMELVLYDQWINVEKTVHIQLKNADVAIVTSYCPDAVLAARRLESTGGILKLFYDLDTPVTFDNIENNLWPDYISDNGLKMFDCVLSYTGGNVLEKLRKNLGAVNVFPLYGCADPYAHFPSDVSEIYECDLSYMGTYAIDRQKKLHELFIEPANNSPQKKFIIAGAMYPVNLQLRQNISYFNHIVPSEHPSFYCSGKFTLNITREAMARNGFCPSGRLFEAAICGTAVISDLWEGIDHFFTPDKEILTVEKASQVGEILNMNNKKRQKIANQARVRCLREHTSRCRVDELLKIISQF